LDTRIHQIMIVITSLALTTVLVGAHVSAPRQTSRRAFDQASSVTHRVYTVKDADDRGTGTDIELRIGREWGSTECWLQFDLSNAPRYSHVDKVTFWFYHTRTTYQENAIRMMGNDDWDWIEDGVDKPDGNWWPDALGWYDYGDAQMPPMWVGWNDTQTAKMGLQYPFEYGPVTGHLTEYVNEILSRENRNLTLVLRNIWGDGAGGSHFHSSREGVQPAFLEFVYIYTLTINSAIGGSTSPIAGSYSYEEGEIAVVAAVPETNYSFDHWMLNGGANSSNPIAIAMDGNYMLTPVFYSTPPPVPEFPLGSAMPIAAIPLFLYLWWKRRQRIS
jgi:hypothetical protein